MSVTNSYTHVDPHITVIYLFRICTHLRVPKNLGIPDLLITKRPRPMYVVV
jgi:hypothetical protein